MCKKVLLYLPFESDFYKGLYEDMKAGFEEAECLVEGGYKYLDSKDMLIKIDLFKPDFVFEMNRTKSEIEDFPSDIIHICWLVDYWERTPSQIKGSDILYVFSDSWIDECRNDNSKLKDVLYPGTNPSVYTINEDKIIDKSMIFLGHMPKPWRDEELERDVELSDKEFIKFKDIQKIIHDFTVNPIDYGTDVMDLKKLIEDKLGIKNFQIPQNGQLIYDITQRSFRQGRRYNVIKQAIESDIKLSLYGNENWLLRKEFYKFYKYNLATKTDMNNAYNQHTFLLHDSSIPHFRVFDAMSSGLIPLRSDCTGYGIEDEWQNLTFKENYHFYTYKLNCLNETITKLKELSIQDIKKVQYNIRDEIIKSHTWKSRALKILKDVKKIKTNNEN